MSDTPPDVRIVVNQNASLRIFGGVPLFDHEGNQIKTPDEGRPYSLCRCGMSARKPFCDQAHKECVWDGTVTAPLATPDAAG